MHYELTLKQGDTSVPISIDPADMKPDYNWTFLMEAMLKRLKELKARGD